MKKLNLVICLLLVTVISVSAQQKGFPKLSFDNTGQKSVSLTSEYFEDTIDVITIQKANEIANRIMIIDCHSHNLFQPGSGEKPKQVSFSMLKESGVKGIVQTFPLDFNSVKNPSEDILNNIRETRGRIKDELLQVSLALGSKDFIAPKSDGSLILMLSVEYFRGIFEGNVEMLEKYHKEGVREIGLVEIGGLDTIYVNDSLTKFGNELINEINRLGIICDITHLSESAQIKIIETSKAPVILSHTNSRGVVNSDFNATDSTLKSHTSKGGITCVTFTAEQVSEKANIEASKMRASKSVDMKKIPKTSIQELINHIDYLKRTIGIDYIGIGSDYGGSGRFAPEGLETIEGFPLIIYHLLKRGYTENEIEKVMGLNFIRFYERVEKIAASK
jgi:membrane dipeptidase